MIVIDGVQKVEKRYKHKVAWRPKKLFSWKNILICCSCVVTLKSSDKTTNSRNHTQTKDCTKKT